ncbi:MAG: transcription termination/antitermination protein NusG [Rickettsiales bacterium]|nr:transcription termination/antitermination protein NusG [Rickettsiales bacterium]
MSAEEAKDIEQATTEEGGVSASAEAVTETPAEEIADNTQEAAPADATEDASLAEAAEEAAVNTDNATAQDATEQVAGAAATKRGKHRWYIIHAYSGFEKKVAAQILEQAAQKGLSDQFEEVVVPTEEIVEVRRGKKVQAERKFFPGYVMAKMVMNDETWQLVKTTDKVTGFLGGGGVRPQAITESEAQAIFQQVEEGLAAPKNAVIFEIGEQVKVVDGPFDSFIGVVEDVDEGKEKLKVSVTIFGRATPVELEFGQVEKV